MVVGLVTGARQWWKHDRWEEAVRGGGGRSSGGVDGWHGGRRRQLVRVDGERRWWEPVGEGKCLSVSEASRWIDERQRSKMIDGKIIKRNKTWIDREIDLVKKIDLAEKQEKQDVDRWRVEAKKQGSCS
ncbi:hypothetical protein Scep_021766 [Stephania cephalantha]|uniref:Uncharacterized protein n=1 Tax=Stephania cephalantha TaxID=152367 RepID=A0AAP0I0H3_9MAGN